MPALFSACVRVRRRSKKLGLNFVRSNFNAPSVAFPAPVLSHGSGLAIRSGEELSVLGKPQNFGISVIQSNVKLCPWAARNSTKALKSKACSDPLLPQS